MRFRYSAKSRNDKTTIKGEIEAPNQKSAIDMLRSKNMIVYALVPMSEGISLNPLDWVSKLMGVTLNEKVMFTSQLASMIKAGLPLTKALEVLESQTKDKNMAGVVTSLLNEVEGGNALNEAMASYPTVFAESYLSLVKAGENSGKLDIVLERLADTLEKQRQFKAKVKGALIYPIIVVGAMSAVFVLIMIFVIPQLSTLYDSLAVELPTATKIIIAISDFLVLRWWVVLAALFGSITAFKMFLRTPTGEETWARFVFHIPIFGSLSKQSGLVEFTRALSLLTQSGVPIVDSLYIVKNATENILYKQSVSRFLDDVKHGFPLSQSVAREPDFPPIVSNLLLVGEETGTIDKSLLNLSVYFEGEVDKIVKNLSTAMEPMIMIMLGIMVAFLILAVITPIYKLTASF